MMDFVFKKEGGLRIWIRSVSFQWKNHDLPLKNHDFLLKNVAFVMKQRCSRKCLAAAAAGGGAGRRR